MTLVNGEAQSFSNSLTDPLNEDMYFPQSSPTLRHQHRQHSVGRAETDFRQGTSLNSRCLHSLSEKELILKLTASSEPRKQAVEMFTQGMWHICATALHLVVTCHGLSAVPNALLRYRRVPKLRETYVDRLLAESVAEPKTRLIQRRAKK